MAFTTAPLEVAPATAKNDGPSQFDMPSKEFVGYDPKGTTTVTGSERIPGTPAIMPKPGSDKQQDSIPETAKESADSASDAPKEETVTLSPKIAALARKEQATRQKEQALKQREQDLAAKIADADKYAELKAKIAAKDYSAAEELGLNYEEYLKHELDKQAKSNPETERVSKLEKQIEDLKKNQEEQVVKDYENNQALWKAEINKVVDADEAFSTIKELKAYDAVLQHVNDSFEEDGVELTVEQAAKEIEDALVARAEKFASVTKIKKKSEVTEAPKAGTEVSKLGAPKNSKTITQDMTTLPTTPKTKPFHLMSETEQIAEAIRRVQAAKQSSR